MAGPFCPVCRPMEQGLNIPRTARNRKTAWSGKTTPSDRRRNRLGEKPVPRGRYVTVEIPASYRRMLQQGAGKRPVHPNHCSKRPKPTTHGTVTDHQIGAGSVSQVFLTFRAQNRPTLLGRMPQLRRRRHLPRVAAGRSGSAAWPWPRPALWCRHPVPHAPVSGVSRPSRAKSP